MKTPAAFTGTLDIKYEYDDDGKILTVPIPTSGSVLKSKILQTWPDISRFGLSVRVGEVEIFLEKFLRAFKFPMNFFS